jgi:hypothetical protein
LRRRTGTPRQRAGTSYSATFVLGTTANNIITIALTNLYLLDTPEDQNRDGKLVENVGFQIGGIVITYS